MSADVQIKSFSKSMAALQKEWPKLKPNERLARLQAMVDTQAISNGFPAPQVVTPQGLGQRNGELRFKDWEVAINPSLIQSNNLSADQTAQLGDTLYHEVRHAEQWNLIARRQAAEGLSAEQIRNQLRIPETVAKAAVKQPLSTSDARRACGDAMYKSVYGSDATARNTTLRNLGKHGKEASAANAEYKKAKSEEDHLRSQLALVQKAYWDRKKGQPPATSAELDALATRYNETNAKLKTAETKSNDSLTKAQSTYSTYQRTYADYRALPEEADAWDSGGRASSAIKADMAPTKKVSP